MEFLLLECFELICMSVYAPGIRLLNEKTIKPMFPFPNGTVCYYLFWKNDQYFSSDSSIAINDILDNWMFVCGVQIYVLRWLQSDGNGGDHNMAWWCFSPDIRTFMYSIGVGVWMSMENSYPARSEFAQKIQQLSKIWVHMQRNHMYVCSNYQCWWAITDYLPRSIGIKSQ